MSRWLGQKFWRQARAESVDALFRMVGYQADMPAAFAASDFAVIPYIGAPTYGRVAVEAQAMALPVIASSIGPLPENILTPPRIDEELRTGWEVPPGDASELARAIENALALDTTAYRAHAARARQFAEYMFSSQRAAAAALAGSAVAYGLQTAAASSDPVGYPFSLGPLAGTWSSSDQGLLGGQAWTGDVDREWARRHHGRWVREQD